MPSKRSERSFLLIWVFVPAVILFFQNCTPAQVSQQQPIIMKLEKPVSAQ